MLAPMALGLGGNAITVSNELWTEMAAEGAPSDGDAAGTGRALRRVVASRAARGGPRLRFAVVHPESGHNYELRYWMSASGIDPDADVEILIVPPPFQPDALAARRTDGYCVGEPYNTIAVARGVGRIATTKSAIWHLSPDKVLGTRAQWAERHPEQLGALVRAATRAARWCGMPENFEELARVLGREDRLNVDPELLVRPLTGRMGLSGGVAEGGPDFFVPFGRAANFPWISHALWFYSQMVRWGQVPHTRENAERAARTYRPDLYRAALAGQGIPMPAANAKVEGALVEPTPVAATGGVLTLGPDGFFDGARFDPDLLDDYIASQGVARE
jgi:NitT/TauT family transport system ATP-binding protein